MKKWIKVLQIVVTAAVMLLGIYLFYNLFKMNLLPERLLYTVTALFGILALIFLVFLWMRKPYIWQKVICVILAICLIGAECIGSYFLTTADQTIASITSSDDEIANVVELITLKSSSITSVSQLNDKTIGTLSTLDKQGTTKMRFQVDEQIKKYDVKEYDTVFDLADALIDGKVDAIILNSHFKDIITDDKNYKTFDEDTRILDECIYYTKKITSAEAVDDITEDPFVVLISGSDSRDGLKTTGRTDSNMLVVVNPQEHAVLLVSIPRDFYVETVCDPAYPDCPEGEKDKLTHTGLYSIGTTKRTLEKLLDVTINYTVHVNFDSVVNLVDALGGIKVYVEEGLAVDSFRALKSFSVKEGWNTLNGKQALAFSRERYAYIDGDHQRVKNQQQVFRQIASKIASPAVITQYDKLMNALAGAMETDMSSAEIQKLIRFQLEEALEWEFYNYQLSGENGNDLVASSGGYAYVMYPDISSVAGGRIFIQDMLEGNISVLEKQTKDGKLVTDGMNLKKVEEAIEEEENQIISDEDEDDYVSGGSSYTASSSNNSYSSSSSSNSTTSRPSYSQSGSQSTVTPSTPVTQPSEDTGSEGGYESSGSTESSGGSTGSTGGSSSSSGSSESGSATAPAPETPQTPAPDRSAQSQESVS